MIKSTTIQEFNKDYPDDDARLGRIFNLRYGKIMSVQNAIKRDFIVIEQKSAIPAMVWLRPLSIGWNYIS